MSATKSDLAGTDGYWTIEVVNRERSETGRRYVCHALDRGHAESIAGHLAGSGAGAAGYDCHRVDNPHGRYARALAIGESEPIEDATVWTVLEAARRSA